MRRIIAIGLAFAQVLAAAVVVSAYAPPSGDLDEDGDGLTTSEEYLLGSDPSNPDSDNGGAGDGWEAEYGFDPTDGLDDSGDADNDGLDNFHEYLASTNPHVRDTDGDGLIDSIDPDPLHPEAYRDCVRDDCGPGLGGTGWGTNGDWPPGVGGQGSYTNLPGEPPDGDSDLDGLVDVFEVKAGTNPFDPDMDRDGLSDGSELNYPGLDPVSRDTDQDGLYDGEETGPLSPADLPELLERGFVSPNTFARAGFDASRITKTDPKVADADHDGVVDGLEDPDGDGLPSLFELHASVVIGGSTYRDPYWGITNPLIADTDCDGLPDGVEVNPDVAPTGIASDPTRLDTDGDGFPDGLDPDPQDTTLLPPLAFADVKLDGVAIDGNASVTVTKQGSFKIFGRLYFTEPSGELTTLPLSMPVDVYVYLVQREGDTWVARQAGPAIQSGDGAFASTVRIGNDALRATESYLFLRTTPLHGDPTKVRYNDAFWTESGAPAFALPIPPVYTTCGGA